jgi:hypothetical protein
MDPEVARQGSHVSGSRRASFYSPFLFGLSLLAASTCAEAENLLVNGDFATDNSGWTIADSSAGQNVVFWTSPAGTPPSPGGTGGSLNLTAFRNSSVTASQCAATSGNVIDASALVFPFVEAGPSIAELEAFDSDDCSGSALGAIPMAPVAPPAPGWIPHQALAALLPGGTRSVRFVLGASDGDNNSDGDYLFDGARLEVLNIFEDGFEANSGTAGN